MEIHWVFTLPVGLNFDPWLGLLRSCFARGFSGRRDLHYSTDLFSSSTYLTILYLRVRTYLVLTYTLSKNSYHLFCVVFAASISTVKLRFSGIQIKMWDFTTPTYLDVCVFNCKKNLSGRFFFIIRKKGKPQKKRERGWFFEMEAFFVKLKVKSLKPFFLSFEKA